MSLLRQPDSHYSESITPVESILDLMTKATLSVNNSHDTPAERVSINDLPNEILEYIITYMVNDWDDKQYLQSTEQANNRYVEFASLRNACKVNRQWCSIAQPLLINFFEPPNLTQKHEAHLYLIRTLIKRPDLAASVKMLNLGPSTWTFNEHGFQPYIYPALLNTMQKAAEKLRPGDEKWQSSLSDSFGDMVVVLMLYLLPNLRTLEFEVPYIDCELDVTSLVFEFIRQSTEPDYPSTYTPLLPKLQTIRLRRNKTDVLFSMEEIEALLLLPKAYEVDAVGVLIQSTYWNRKSKARMAHEMATRANETNRYCTFWRNQKFQVRVLRLKSVCIHSKKSFDSFIKSFQTLHVLELTSVDAEYWGCYLCMSDVNKALQNHAGSLQRLCLDINNWGESDREGQFFGSLANFTKLTNLTLRAVFLVGFPSTKESAKQKLPPQATILPPSLEELEILDVASKVPEYLWDMGMNMAGITNLKVVWCPEWDASTSIIRRDDIADVFNSFSVALPIRSRWIHESSM